MTIQRDGNMWIIATTGFKNLQESSNYLFLTKNEYKKLREHFVQTIKEKAEKIDDQHCSDDIVTRSDLDKAYGKLMVYILSL